MEIRYLLTQEEYEELKTKNSFNEDVKISELQYSIDQLLLFEQEKNKVLLFDKIIKEMEDIESFQDIITLFSSLSDLRIVKKLKKLGWKFQYHENPDDWRGKEFKVEKDDVNKRSFWVFKGQFVLLFRDKTIYTVSNVDEFDLTVDLLYDVDDEIMEKTVPWKNIRSTLRDSETGSYESLKNTYNHGKEKIRYHISASGLVFRQYN